MQLTPRVGLTIALGLGFAAYANTLRNGWVLDDTHLIALNPAIGKLDSPANIWHPNAKEENRFFRPIPFATLHLQAALSGTEPAPFHAVNLLMHLAVVAMLFAFCSAIGTGAAAATATAVFFAVHPAISEAVCEVVNRFDLMATLFALGALLIAVRGAARSRFGPIVVLSSLTYLVALLCKESAAALPLVALLCGLVGLLPRRRAVILALALFATTALYLLIRAQVLGGALAHAPGSYFRTQPWPVHLQTMLAVFVRYWRLMVFPLDLSPDYGPMAVVPSLTIDAWVAAGAVLLLLTIGAVVVLRRRQPLVSFGLGFFLICMLPIAHIVPMSILMAERFLYLPFCGIAIAAGAALELLPVRRSVRTAIVLVVGSGLACRTAVRTFDWHDPFAFWSAAVEAVPEAGFSRAHLGVAFCARGQYVKGAVELERALPLAETNTWVLHNLVWCYQKAARPADALSLSKQAQQLYPDDPRFYLTAAVAHITQAELKEAVDEAVRGLQQKPDDEGLRAVLRDMVQNDPTGAVVRQRVQYWMPRVSGPPQEFLAGL